MFSRGIGGGRQHQQEVIRSDVGITLFKVKDNQAVLWGLRFS